LTTLLSNGFVPETLGEHRLDTFKSVLAKSFEAGSGLIGFGALFCMTQEKTLKSDKYRFRKPQACNQMLTTQQCALHLLIYWEYQPLQLL
jgi:hypothetical protein